MSEEQIGNEVEAYAAAYEAAYRAAIAAYGNDAYETAYRAALAAGANDKAAHTAATAAAWKASHPN